MAFNGFFMAFNKIVTNLKAWNTNTKNGIKFAVKICKLYLVKSPQFRLEESFAGLEPLTSQLHRHICRHVDILINFRRILSVTFQLFVEISGHVCRRFDGVTQQVAVDE